MTGEFSRRLSGRGQAFGIKFRPGAFHPFQRYRMHEAAEKIAEGRAGDMGDLALRLGYFDQAHFIRDFKAIVGRPPGQYRAASETQAG